MSQSPRHGAAGCPCEECLTARITQSVALAGNGRDMTSLRTLFEGLRTPSRPLSEARRAVS